MSQNLSQAVQPVPDLGSAADPGVLYACMAPMCVCRVPTWLHEGTKGGDLALAFPEDGILPGAYRRVDRTYLGYLARRIDEGEKTGSVPADRLVAAVDFLYRLISLSGFQPCDPWQIPAGYARPAPHIDDLRCFD